jgi:hypothetical protein
MGRKKLKDFNFNRRGDVYNSTLKVVDYISDYVEQEKIQNLLKIYKECFNVPLDVSSQYLKSNIYSKVDYKKSKCFHSIGISSFIFSILKNVVFIGVIFLKRNIKNEKVEKYDLMIDKIYSELDLSRFKKLINLYGKENVVAISLSEHIFQFNNIKIVQKKKYNNYYLDFNDFIKIIKFLFYSIYYSIILNENLLNNCASLINTYYYYNTLFKHIKSKNCIIFQHYETDSIKNYLFKKHGGIQSCSTQKNIHQLGLHSAFYDSDIFFALSNESAQRPIKFGARFRKIISCGSLFMENEFYSNKNKKEKMNADIVIVGGNGFYDNGPFDIYDSQYNDYLTHLEWINQLSIEKPNLKIVFKSHSNFELDNSIEKNVLKYGNVIILNPKIDSYQLCSKAKIIYSWASTMIVEMRTLNIPSFFLDPGHRNNQFNQSNELWEKMRISTYESLLETTNKFIDYDTKNKHLMTDYCDISTDTSLIIYNNLKS